MCLVRWEMLFSLTPRTIAKSCLNPFRIFLTMEVGSKTYKLTNRKYSLTLDSVKLNSAALARVTA